VDIANHTFILLDAVSLIEEDYRRYAAEVQLGEWQGVPGGVIEFIKNLSDSKSPVAREIAKLTVPRRSTSGTQDPHQSYSVGAPGVIDVWTAQRKGQTSQRCGYWISEFAGE
jgi:hypothetical protein